MKEQKEKSNKIFTKVTKQFKIQATLSDTHLNLTLEDYVDWIIYSKSYTEEDIGKQIHRKADLADLFQSLSQCTQNLYSDEKKMEERSFGQKNIEEYQFGDIVTFKDRPYYKVEKEGIIIIYIHFIDRNLSYESKLSLNRVKKLSSEQEKIIFKMEQQKYRNIGQQKLIYLQVQDCDKLIQSLKNYKSQIESLKLQICGEKNPHPNKRVTSQLQRRQRFEKRDLQEKLIEKQKEQTKLNKRIQEMQQQLKKERQINKNINQKLKQNEQLFKLRERSFHLIQNYTEKIIREKVKEIKNNEKQLRISQNIIEFIGNKYYSYKSKYYLNKIIPLHQKFTIKLKLIRLNTSVKFGVYDFQKLTQKSSDDSIYIFEKESSTKDLFKQGKTILLSYEFGGKIQLQIDGKIYFQKDEKKFMNNDKLYLLFVQFCSQNDIIEIL